MSLLPQSEGSRNLQLITVLRMGKCLNDSAPFLERLISSPPRQHEWALHLALFSRPLHPLPHQQRVRQSPNAFWYAHADFFLTCRRSNCSTSPSHCLSFLVLKLSIAFHFTCSYLLLNMSIDFWFGSFKSSRVSMVQWQHCATHSSQSSKYVVVDLTCRLHHR